MTKRAASRTITMCTPRPRRGASLERRSRRRRRRRRASHGAHQAGTAPAAAAVALVARLSRRRPRPPVPQRSRWWSIRTRMRRSTGGLMPGLVRGRARPPWGEDIPTRWPRPSLLGLQSGRWSRRCRYVRARPPARWHGYAFRAATMRSLHTPNEIQGDPGM